MKLLAVMLLLAAAGSPLAYAHPFTEETLPPQFSSAPAGTAEVIVRYSEEVEIEFSRLEVIDSSGERVDNRDTGYYDSDRSLIVTTPPLQDGVYTVTSKVLSRVDGHLVPDAFIFGVGDVALPEEGPEGTSDLIFLPEAGARFPGLVGQTVVLGALIASMFICGAAGIGRSAEAEHRRHYHGKFMRLVGIGLVAVFVSNIVMLAIQMWRLEATALDVLQTGFGGTWIIRMSLTAAMLGAWFALERREYLSTMNQIPMLAMALALIATTTMLGHGAASQLAPAIALDYVHNLVASVWIGGIIFLAMALLPSLGRLKAVQRERKSLAIIPRFSGAVVICLGLVMVSGPMLMYLLESDLGTITASTYGWLIISKILIASVMVGIGGYYQFGVQRKAESDIKFPANRSLRRVLRIEAGLGVALLLVVALLTNGTLPAGEVQEAEARPQLAGLAVSEFTGNARFDVRMAPFATGANLIDIRASALDGSPIPDMSAIKVKVSNPGRGIFPIEVPVEAVSGEAGSYRGEITFGFSGDWLVEIEAQRTEGGNEGVSLSLLVKPELENLRAEIVEYEFPEPAAPLYPVYDGDGSIWISDASGPQIWRYAIAEQEFTKYAFSGESSITLDVDGNGRVWFTDVPAGRIGFLEPETGEYRIVELPRLVPANQRSLPVFIDVDQDGIVWTAVVNKNVILRYDPDTGEFEKFEMPTEDSGPFSVKAGSDGRVWFTQQAAGQLGYIDPGTGRITEYSPDPPLVIPETITFDSDGRLWIAEHQEGGSITRFDPLLETFTRVPVQDVAALPNSPVQDRYGNVWFAQHTVDKLGVYDPDRNYIMDVPIPTEQSWIQFATLDGDGNVWFVEQMPYRLGTVRLAELPGGAAPSGDAAGGDPGYAEVAGPLMAAGIVAAALFLVKSVRDRRRIDLLLEEGRPAEPGAEDGGRGAGKKG